MAKSVNPQPVDEWRAKDDADTLMRAEAVKQDKARHSAALGHAQKIVQQAQNVVGKPKTAVKAASKPRSSGSKRGK